MGTRETCLMSASEAQWESQWDEPVIERRAILGGSRSADEEQHRAAKIDLEGSLLSLKQRQHQKRSFEPRQSGQIWR